MSRLLATSSTIVALFSVSAAQADIKVCNDFRTPIHVAFASQDKGSFTAAGWWTVAPKACQAVDFTFKGTTLYYTADSDSYQIGNTSNQNHWGNVVQLFVTSGDFKSDNAEISRGDAKAEKFSLAEIPAKYGKNPVSTTLRFAQGSVTMNFTGRLAGRRWAHRS